MTEREKKNQQRPGDRRDDQRTDAPAKARKNPRIVIGGLDYFDLIMEQEEQK